jgi:hypothetical protein
MSGIHSPKRRASPRDDASLGAVGLLGLWRRFRPSDRKARSRGRTATARIPLCGRRTHKAARGEGLVPADTHCAKVHTSSAPAGDAVVQDGREARMDYRPVQWLQSSRTMWRRDAAPRVSALYSARCHYPPGRLAMNRRDISGLFAIAALELALLPGSAVSQQKSLKQIVGLDARLRARRET